MKLLYKFLKFNEVFTVVLF